MNPSEDGFLKTIEWNHEEIKAQVAQKVSEYKGLVYTDDNIKAAKADVAALRKFVQALENKRKEVKAKCMEPYELFEKQIKEIVAIVNEPISLIDSQIKEVEEARKIEKKGEILEYFNEVVGNLKGYISFEKVFRQEYLNATKSMKSIKEEIAGSIDKISADLATIEGLDTQYELQVKDYYIRTLDLSMALREDARLKELAEKEKMRKQREEAERLAKQEEQENSSKPGKMPSEPEKVQNTDNQKAAAVLPEYVVGINVYGTRKELDAFCVFLKSNNIRYEVTRKPEQVKGE